VPSSDDIELRVHELGGSGPPLLLAHATGLHGRVWEPVAADLPSHRCIALDFRGHGDSPAPDDHNFDWHGFADDVLAVIDTLGIERPAGVGHSKGGAALLLAEERRPGTFSGLWCYEPVVFPRVVPSQGRVNDLAESARRRRDRFSSRTDAVENFSSKPPFQEVAPASLAAYVDGGFETAEDGSLLLKCRPEHEARVYEMGSEHTAYENLGLVACPVAIARGRIEAGPAMIADQLTALIPTCELVAFDDLGHFGPLEAPERVAGQINRFLRSI